MFDSGHLLSIAFQIILWEPLGLNWGLHLIISFMSKRSLQVVNVWYLQLLTIRVGVLRSSCKISLG